MKRKKPENNVVPLDISKKKRSRTYAEALKIAYDGVDEMHRLCFSNAVTLAMSGKWKEWSESQPVGATMQINEGMLRETGDPIVIRFMDMIKWIELLRFVIENEMEEIEDKE